MAQLAEEKAVMQSRVRQWHTLVKLEGGHLLVDPGVVQRRSTHAMAVVCWAWIKITAITVHAWSQRTIIIRQGFRMKGRRPRVSRHAAAWHTLSLC